MLLIHAIKSAVRVDGMPAGPACDAGNRVRLVPAAAATAAETSFSAAQR